MECIRPKAMGGTPITAAQGTGVSLATREAVLVSVASTLGPGQESSASGRSIDCDQRRKQYSQVGTVSPTLGKPLYDNGSESEDEFTPAFAEDFEMCQQGIEKYCVAPLPFCPSDLPFQDTGDDTPFDIVGFCAHCGKAVRSGLQAANFCAFCGKERDSDFLRCFASLTR